MTTGDLLSLPLHDLVPPARDDRSRAERSYLRYAGAGLEFGLTIALLAVAGIWLDGRFHTSPVLTIVLSFVGLAAATWNLLRTVQRAESASKQDDRP